MIDAGIDNDIFFWEKNFKAEFGETVFSHYQDYQSLKDSISNAENFLKAFQSLKWLQ